MINRKNFYDTIRPFFNGCITNDQFAGLEIILNYWEQQKLTDLRWLAYMLATVYHETGKTMQPCKEGGRGRGHKYGIADPKTGFVYYGRGYVQLTWIYNYRKMGKLLGIDLVNNPDLACKPEIAVKIMFEGMLKANSSFGDFTGKCLEQYFTETE